MARQPRIRAKFIGILIMAAVIPVTAALLLFETLGYRSYREARGRLFQAQAHHVAAMLNDMVRHELGSLNDWLTLTEFNARVAAAAAGENSEEQKEIRAKIDEVESRWPGLGADDPLLRGILTSEIAGQLNAFRSLHQVFAEIFVTDRHGRVLAATGKTSDYGQDDEEWWRRGFSLKSGVNYVEGIHYDESARVFSLDVAVPIRDRARADAPPFGVLKGVMNVTPLFDFADPIPSGDAATRQVMLEDGRLLATLQSSGAEPMKERIPNDARVKILRDQTGWMISKVADSQKELIGYAPLDIGGKLSNRLEVTGATPMYVLIRQSADVVLAPARQQILLLGLAGAVTLFGFIVAGYLVATRKLIGPIENLRESVHRIAGSVKLDCSLPPSPAATAVLEPLSAIKTKDELEDLAKDVSGMAQRVLGYNQQLEYEIAEKTSEISRDLELAREFQEALMPKSFPEIPTDAELAPFRLEFRHLYKPAHSVGGDFFNVAKLDDLRAGVFIADVMGHGARSALVAAILRTLLQNLGIESTEPARFLASLNRHFHAIVRSSGETIFVSAFYMVVDTGAGTICYASAGHPSPFVASRRDRQVRPLIDQVQGNPALGILPEVTYKQWTRALRGGELFILFTDGVHEACNEAGEDFGVERMREAIQQQMDREISDIPAAIFAELQSFIAPALPGDDICIVAFEAKAARVRTEIATSAFNEGKLQ